MILEFYFRILTLLFWTSLLFNWIFIPNLKINRYIVIIYFIFSLIYIILLTLNKFKHKINTKDKINFYYKFICIVAFVVSILYFLLYSNSIKLLIIKTLIVFLYFYISCQMLKSKDEEGVVGIISSILIFIFATYY